MTAVLPDFHDVLQRHAAKLAVLAVSYFALGKLTLLLATEQVKVPPIWPPAGLALSACLVLGPGFWPGVLLGSLALRLSVGDQSDANALLLAMGDAVAALVGSASVRKFSRPEDIFLRVETACLFIGLAVLSAPIIGTSLATAGISITEGAMPDALFEQWWTGWLGSASGALIVTPFFLGLTGKIEWSRLHYEQYWHWLLVAVVSGFVFSGWLHPQTAHYPTSSLILPFLVWAVLHFGTLGVASSVLTVALIATVSTVIGLGPFFQPDLHASLRLLDGYILVIGGTVYVVHGLVTEHKQAGEKMAETNRRLELALNGGDLGTWDWNVRSGDAVFCERWANMLGYSLDELEPHYRSWERLLHPEDRERVLKTLHEHLLGKTSHYESEYRLLTKSGRWKWVAAHGRVYERGPDGSPQRAAGIHKDISVRKELEEHVREKQAELFCVQRLTTAGELAATMAHEINQPLGAIASYLTGINLRYGKLLADYPELENAIQETMRLSERAGEVVQGIRNLVNRHETEWEWLAPGALLRECVTLVRPELLRRHVKYETMIADQLPRINGQRVLLQQLLINLIFNAMESMETNATGVRELRIQACPGERGRSIEVSVEDSGSGIAQDMQEKIFEPFVSSKANGMGLGLPICRTIAEAHGGSLTVRSSPGEGATFVLFLPVCRESDECHVC